MHPVLLKGQGLTIERPARSTGTAVGIGVSGLALALALALFARGLGWPISFPQFLAYAGAGAMTIVAAAFAFWTWACATMRYVVGPTGVTIHWGPMRQQIPIARIEALTQGRGEQRPRIAGIGWLGYHVGRGEVEGYERVIFYSTHRVPEDIVFVRTPEATFALSPQDRGRFIAEVVRYREAAGGVSTESPMVERSFVASHPIWTDRPAQLLTAAAVLLNLALWGYVFAVYPDLSNEITIEFPPIGDITTLESRDEILKIPGTASVMLGVNLLASFVFQPRERAATYLLLSGTALFQVVFCAAAIVAVVNA